MSQPGMQLNTWATILDLFILIRTVASSINLMLNHPELAQLPIAPFWYKVSSLITILAADDLLLPRAAVNSQTSRPLSMAAMCGYRMNTSFSGITEKELFTGASVLEGKTMNENLRPILRLLCAGLNPNN